MTGPQKISLKLKILKEFEGLRFTLVEMYEIIDELKSEISRIAIDKELQRLKFKGDKL